MCVQLPAQQEGQRPAPRSVLLPAGEKGEDPPDKTSALRLSSLTRLVCQCFPDKVDINAALELMLQVRSSRCPSLFPNLPGYTRLTCSSPLLSGSAPPLSLPVSQELLWLLP